jgi:hypothetical protein
MLSKYVSNSAWIVSPYRPAYREAAALDRLDCQARHVLEGDVQHGVLGHRGVPVADHPPLVELGRLRVGQFGRDVPK